MSLGLSLVACAYCFLTGFVRERGEWGAPQRYGSSLWSLLRPKAYSALFQEAIQRPLGQLPAPFKRDRWTSSGRKHLLSCVALHEQGRHSAVTKSLTPMLLWPFMETTSVWWVMRSSELLLTHHNRLSICMKGKERLQIAVSTMEPFGQAVRAALIVKNPYSELSQCPECVWSGQSNIRVLLQQKRQVRAWLAISLWPGSQDVY